MNDLSRPERHANGRVRHELRRRLLTVETAERGLPKAWVKAAGYWRSGPPSIHDTHDA